MAKDKTGAERYRRWYRANQEEVNNQRRLQYASRKASGLCPRCGKDTGSGKLCDDCLKKARVWNRNEKKQD